MELTLQRSLRLSGAVSLACILAQMQSIGGTFSPTRANGVESNVRMTDHARIAVESICRCGHVSILLPLVLAMRRPPSSAST